ncbi:hypothetical protein BDV93DRAFT_37514 [Ceratobasidium sp. AG-I]|nr:hypothetical protein BDV93DRAFT_37514 [Ceratobasidium sp. AG-I]
MLLRRTGMLQLRLGFTLAALLVPILHSKVPPYDTSHLIQSKLSRYLYEAPQLAATTIKPPSDLELPPNLIPLPGLRWDAQHYHSIASYGTYIYEEQYAFPSGVPISLRLVHIAKYCTLLGVRRLFATRDFLRLSSAGSKNGSWSLAE